MVTGFGCRLSEDDSIEDLTSKVFRVVVENGKDGILQSELWKKLDLTSRDGSRLSIRLERRSLIKREKVLESGRWTYKLIAIKLPVDTTCIEQAPCLTCPVEHMCSVDSAVSPNTCMLIENWILNEIGRSEQLINITTDGKKYAPARG
ncbi:MAG: transcriptional regulator [Nitrososphaerales archaeon]